MLRHPVNLDATLTVEGVIVDCRVRNVSLGGVFVVGPKLPIHTRVRLVFGGRGLSDLEVDCTVRWSSAEGSGLMFDGLRAAETYKLAAFIARASRPTGRLAREAILRPL